MKSADEIYCEMCSNYAELTGLTVRDGCDMAVRLYAAAAQIESLYAYNDWVKKQCFPQTATGEYLDNHAIMRGLKRIEATYSTGIIQFTAQAAVAVDLTVPKDTVCVTASGIRFATTENGVIASGETSCECAAIAMEAGSSGNVEAEAIAFMQQAPVGIVSCINVSGFAGGVDGEDDDSLRERILATYTSLPNGANAAYYEQLAKSVTGVEAVKVIPKERGVGTVDVIITAVDGMPDDALINEVLSIINQSREICVNVKVYAPTAVTVNVQIGIEAESGYDFNKVSGDVQLAIEKYFDGKLLGCDVLRVKLGDIVFGIDGVRNYTIALPVNDTEITDNELPILGTLTVNALN